MRVSGPQSHNAWSPDDLGAVHLFLGVDPFVVDGLLDSCRLVLLEPGEALVRAGEVPGTAWFLLSGALRVHPTGAGDPPAGWVAPGQDVGLVALLDRRPAPAWVVADLRSRLLALDEEVLWSLVRASHVASGNLLFALTRHLRGTPDVRCGGLVVEPVARRPGSIDPLTGLHNRAWLDRTLERVAGRSAEAGEPFTVLFLDVDRFRRLNRRFGHLTGDAVLQTVAQGLVDTLRPSELICRYGGDEFVVLLPGLDTEAGRSVADRIRLVVREAAPVLGPTGPLPATTVSVGVATAVPDQPPAQLLAAADAALFRAKARGRDRVVCAGEDPPALGLVVG